MSVEEQIKRLEDLINYVEKELPLYVERVIASDLAALVANRVTQKGEDFKGGSFSPYSTVKIPSRFFWGKSRNQTAETKVRAFTAAEAKANRAAKKSGGAKVGGALSYADFRKLNNLKTDKKNFEFTTEMWRKFGVVYSNSSAGGTFNVKLGGLSTEAQRKIDENSAKEGYSIIEANEKERNIAQRTAGMWLDDTANRILNSK